MHPWIRIVRPINVLFTFAVVVVIITMIAPANVVTPATLWAALSAALIGAGGNVINDVCDLEIDRINRPDRVLVQNNMTTAQATGWASVLFCTGILISLQLGWENTSVAILAAGGLVGYSVWLKRTPLWGNLTVSFFSGLTFLYGGLAVAAPQAALFPAGFAFFIHLARELIKDMEDLEGDKRQDARTFPIVFGVRAATGLATLAMVALSLLIAIAYRLRQYNDYFLYISLLTVFPLLTWVVVKIWRDPGPNDLNTASRLLKITMIAGLVALFAGSLKVS